MKKIIILIMACMITNYCIAQNNNKENIREQIKTAADTLSVEQKDIAFFLLEEAVLAGVDSIINEGRYLQALELMDSIQVNWKYLTGREPSPSIYLKKGIILMRLEEWKELIKTTKECISIHKETISNGSAAIIYSMQGTAYVNTEEYREAIHSYEEGISYFNKTGDIGGQGNMLCNMGRCYSKINKFTMASSFYEKGIIKYLEYFKTTRSTLLQKSIIVKDQRKKIDLPVFAEHLFSLAVFEQDYGSRVNSREYLLMSAHCGNTAAKSEYQRIYGNR